MYAVDERQSKEVQEGSVNDNEVVGGGEVGAEGREDAERLEREEERERLERLEQERLERERE